MDADSHWEITVLNWFGYYMALLQQPCALWRHRPLLVQPYVSLPWQPHGQLKAEERGSACTHSHTVFEALLVYV